MADFSHLSKLQVTKDLAAEYELYHIAQADGTSPTLVLSPATEANKPYYNAMLKRASSQVRQVKTAGIRADMLEKNRADDRELFPAFVVTGWKNVLDAECNPVKFGRKDCEAFIDALPDWVFDDVRDFAATHSNFVREALQPGNVAKN